MKPKSKNSVGRPRTASIKLPIYDGMAQCSGATGIPESVIKKAKRDGSPAFQAGGRVNLGELLRWLYRPDAGDSQVLDRNQEQAKLARANTVAQELENLENSERLHDVQRVEDLVWEGAVAPIRAMVIGLKKVTVRQIISEMDNAGVPQTTQDAVARILTEALDGGLAIIRNGFKSKV